MSIQPNRSPSRAEHGASLTARELEIVALIADGERTAEIARRLGLSENTVKSHATRAYRKLGVRNRVEAALAYLVRYDRPGGATDSEPAATAERSHEVPEHVHAWIRLIERRLDELRPAADEAAYLREALAALRAIGRE